MALGGYKFSGFKYARPNDWPENPTDEQIRTEALKMHKGRLKAFVTSNSMSGSQWAFSYSAGDYSFETYGNVIYKMDSSGFNLVSFFRYGNENAYFAIITLNDASLNSGYSLKINNYYYYYNNSTLNRIYLDRPDFYCSSLVDLNISNINMMPSLDRLAMDSCFNQTLTSSGGDSVSDGILARDYGFHQGFAIKGKSIIMIRATTLSSIFRFKICSFDSILPSSPNDTKNIFQFATGSSISSSASLDYNAMSGYIQVLNHDGVPYELDSHSSNTGKSAALFVAPVSQAACNAFGNTTPYEQMVITPGANRTAGTFINNDGILTKGKIKLDLLAVNNVFPTTDFVAGATFANGNYLYIGGVVTTSADASTRPLSRIFYCGWDPSNPDITQQSAWTEYTGA